MISLPSLTMVYADQRASGLSDLDRYVRREYGDATATWFAEAIAAPKGLNTADGGAVEGPLVRLRRAVRAFIALL